MSARHSMSYARSNARKFSIETLEWPTVKIVPAGHRADGCGSRVTGIVIHALIQRKDRPRHVTIWKAPKIGHGQPAAVADHHIPGDRLKGCTEMLLRFQSQRSLARWVDPKRAELLQVEHLRRVTDHEDRDTARANDGGGAEVPRLPTTHRPVTD